MNKKNALNVKKTILNEMINASNPVQINIFQMNKNNVFHALKIVYIVKIIFLVKNVCPDLY